MSLWRVTLIMEGPARPWTPEEIDAVVDLGLIDAQFDTFEGDAFVIGSREADTFGKAVGEAIDLVQAASGRKVRGVQREPDPS